jgi:hypothetical protein
VIFGCFVGAMGNEEGTREWKREMGKGEVEIELTW